MSAENNSPPSSRRAAIDAAVAQVVQRLPERQFFDTPAAAAGR